MNKNALIPFNYDLPQEKIAQRPVYPYDQAKLLVVNRETGELTEVQFLNLPDFLNRKDLLFFNNTRVIKARLFGSLKETGGAVELLLVEKDSETKWECIGRPLKKLKPGIVIEFDSGLFGEVEQQTDSGRVVVNFTAKGSVPELLKQVGVMPIPPYIRKGKGDEQDIKDYQTFFAEHDGSVAAPTASLHFTSDVIDKIRGKDCEIEYITLHVGAASFQAVWDESGPIHPEEEQFVFSQAALDKISEIHSRDGKVIAVGTTSVRALESMSKLKALDGKTYTDLFIYPGYQFKAVDAVVTNFHQPQTSHMLLIEALLGRELLEYSYKYALDNDFRFLSYGDGMLIL